MTLPQQWPRVTSTCRYDETEFSAIWATSYATESLLVSQKKSWYPRLGRLDWSFGCSLGQLVVRQAGREVKHSVDPSFGQSVKW